MPRTLIQDYPGADLILDIRTSRWGIHSVKGPSTTGPVHFAVGYDGSLRLIDARKRAVVAAATCSVQFSNGDDPPAITELLEDDCALLDKGLMLTSQNWRSACEGARAREAEQSWVVMSSTQIAPPRRYRIKLALGLPTADATVRRPGRCCSTR